MKPKSIGQGQVLNISASAIESEDLVSIPSDVKPSDFILQSFSACIAKCHTKMEQCGTRRKITRQWKILSQVENWKSHEENLKGVLNPNFRLFSFELNKHRFFEMNFDLVSKFCDLGNWRCLKLFFHLEA